MVKAGVIRAKYGKKASQRYMRACSEYDGLSMLGIRGTQAWLIREAAKSRRGKRTHKIESSRYYPVTPVVNNRIGCSPEYDLANRKRNMALFYVGLSFFFLPALIVTLPNLIIKEHRLHNTPRNNHL